MAARDEYWSAIEDEVARLDNSSAPASPLHLRSNDFSDAHGVQLSGIGDETLFGYLSIPRAEGPFPAILMLPGYASVVQVPILERRREFVVLSICARGQRLSDKNYAAAFPGLLTDRITDPDEYPFRGIAADCLTAFDYLASRPEVDPARIGLASGGAMGDLALITAALRPDTAATLVNTPMLFRDACSRFPETHAYPLEELNDHLRANPGDASALRETIDLFDPIHLAGRIQSKARISFTPADEPLITPLANAIPASTQTCVLTGRGHTDHAADEAWLQATLKT